MGRAGGRVQGCWQTPTHSPVQEMLQATKTNIAFCHLETFLWLSNDLSYSGQAVVRGKDGIRPCSFIQNLLAPCCLYQHPWGPRSQHLPKSCSISCNLPLTGPHLPRSQESCLHVSTITVLLCTISSRDSCLPKSHGSSMVLFALHTPTSGYSPPPLSCCSRHTSPLAVSQPCQAQPSLRAALKGRSGHHCPPVRDSEAEAQTGSFHRPMRRGRARSSGSYPWADHTGHLPFPSNFRLSRDPWNPSPNLVYTHAHP